MSRFRQAFRGADLWGAGLWDVLSGVAALAYILGFVAAIEIALGKLSY